MNREDAIREVDWYHNLVRAKIREWGYELNRDARDLLLSNLEEVIDRREELKFKQLKSGYYIGQVDEDGLRNGYGITTHTTPNHNRWVMQAGLWHEERAEGWHTFYDSDCPKPKHFLALVKFKGERKSESGMIEFSLSDKGSNFTRRKYRRYEGFSWSTLAVGSIILFFFFFWLTRRIFISLCCVAIAAALYTIGAANERQ